MVFKCFLSPASQVAVALALQTLPLSVSPTPGLPSFTPFILWTDRHLVSHIQVSPSSPHPTSHPPLQNLQGSQVLWGN